MVEKFIGPSVEWLSELYPGYKTKVAIGFIVGMIICEVSGRIWGFGHQFDVATWAMIPATPSMTILLRKYKETKDQLKEIKE